MHNTDKPGPPLAPDFQQLISDEFASIRSQIARTKRPIFNLWRLVTGPCEEKHEYHNRAPDGGRPAMGAGVLVVGVFGVICCIIDRHFWSSAVTGLLTVFLALHALNDNSWSEHAEELKQKRDGLILKLFEPGSRLATSLKELIVDRSNQSIGAGSEFQTCLVMLGKRMKEQQRHPLTESESELPLQEKLYRDSAGEAHWRVDTSEPETDLAKIFADMQDFSLHVGKTVVELTQRAESIGASVDSLKRLEATPQASDAAQDLTLLRTAIQAEVEAIYQRLAELAQSARGHCSRAMRAQASSIAQDAQAIANALQSDAGYKPTVPAAPSESVPASGSSAAPAQSGHSAS